jgi:DNA-binding beta-propeller fold protein YncE
MSGMMTTGDGPRFEVCKGWGVLPEGWNFLEVAGVATNSRDRVFVFNRGEHPIIIFDRNGRFEGAWGEGLFTRPHGITIGPDDAVYCSDDSDHTVKKFHPEGKPLMTLGTSGCPSDTGVEGMDFRTIRCAGPPFHYPTNVALAADGSLYISDGYSNARIHRFSREGVHLFSWGEPGSGPGQFRLPHGIAVAPDGTVVVADRENSRLQFFNPEGRYLRQCTDVARPCQALVDAASLVYVAELGYRAGMWPGTTSPSADATGGRVSVFDWDGKLVARWGGGLNPFAPGDFYAPHDLCLDSRGDLYVGEVTWSAGGNRGEVPADCHSLQKFTRAG